MSSILVSAVIGAAGGVVGSGIAWLVGRAMNRQPKWLAVIPIACIALALSVGRNVRPSFADEVLAELDEAATVQAIKQHYPDDYANLAARVWALSPSTTPEEARVAVSGVVLEVMARERPKANESSSSALFEVTREQGRALQMVDPAGCAAFMGGQGAPPSLMKVLTPQMQARDVEISGRLLVQAAMAPAAPASPMSENELVRLSQQALLRLPESQQSTVVKVLSESRTPKSDAEHQAMCAFDLALADVILAQPRPGAAVRSLWATP